MMSLARWLGSRGRRGLRGLLERLGMPLRWHGGRAAAVRTETLPRARLRDARPSLSLYSEVYGGVAAPRGSRDVRVATPSLTSWRER